MNTNTAQNLVAVVVKYVGPTDYRGSRIKMSLPRFGESRSISYDYESRDAEDGAARFLRNNGCEPVARACGADHAAILLYSFDQLDALLAVFRK